MLKVIFPLLLLSVALTTSADAQRKPGDADAFQLREIHDRAMTQGQAYDWLLYLTQRIGGRLSGTPQAAAAVEYARQVMDTIGFDSVVLQPVMVPHWSRGEKEVVRVANSVAGSFDLNALALGGSVGTGPGGIAAEIIEVNGLEAIDSLGEEVRGKIVFYNQPMDPTQLNAFAAYGSAVGQRVYGATRAAKYGAIGALVRSMTNRQDDVPHTGSAVYLDEYPKTPAIAISTNDADRLSDLLKVGPVSVYIRTTSQMLPEKLSYNVIGEIRGSQYPEEILLVGGHLDSWDVGTGAHDDGAGVVHAMDAIYILRKMGWKPQRTIRCVAFMNEENGLRGAREYARVSDERNEFHLAAIESDRGGFTPRGFSVQNTEGDFNKRFKKLLRFAELLEAYDLYFEIGGSGADIGPLKGQGGMLIGFLPDSQRYFDYHHTPTDNADAVSKRELQLGVAAIASLVYLIDTYGL